MLHRCIALTLAATAFAPQISAQSPQPVFRRVVFDGDPAPGLPGLAFNAFGAPAGFGELIAPPSIDKQGNVAFHAFAGPDEVSFFAPNGIWREVDGQIAAVVLGGDPAPGTNVNFVGFPLAGSTPLLSNGRVTFHGGLPTPEGSLQLGLWSDRFGPIENVLLDDDHLPGTPPTATVFDFIVTLREKNVLINARYSDQPFVGPDHEGLWRDGSGAFQVVAVDGMQAPGFPAGASFGIPPSFTLDSPIGTWSANSKGRVAFNGRTVGPVDPMETDDEGIWFEDAAGLHLLVREKDPAPALSPTALFGARNGILSFANSILTLQDIPVTIGDSGAVVFGASVQDVDYPRRPSIWTNRNGSLEIVALGDPNLPGGLGPKGSPAPGYPVGATFFEFPGSFALINASERIAFSGLVLEENPLSITTGIFWDVPGPLTLAARELGAAPGIPGVTLLNVFLSTLSDGGVLVYAATLAGPGVNASNDFAFFAVEPSGAQHLLVREGAPFDVSGNGTDVRTVRTLQSGPGGTDAGERVFEIFFTDGTFGLFTGRVEGALPRLFADAPSISATEGGIVDLALDAGKANGGRVYVLLGGASGSSPGLPLPGGPALPVNVDAFTEATLGLVNSPTLDHFVANLDATGAASARIDTGGPLPPSLVGLQLTFAYTLVAPFDFVSNPVTISIAP